LARFCERICSDCEHSLPDRTGHGSLSASWQEIGSTPALESAIGQKLQNPVLFPSRSRAGAKMKRVSALASCKDGKERLISLSQAARTEKSNGFRSRKLQGRKRPMNFALAGCKDGRRAMDFALAGCKDGKRQWFWLLNGFRTEMEDGFGS
jgi:hypothetical protein